ALFLPVQLAGSIFGGLGDQSDKEPYVMQRIIDEEGVVTSPYNGFGVELLPIHFFGVEWVIGLMLLSGLYFMLLVRYADHLALLAPAGGDADADVQQQEGDVGVGGEGVVAAVGRPAEAGAAPVNNPMGQAEPPGNVLPQVAPNRREEGRNR